MGRGLRGLSEGLQGASGLEAPWGLKGLQGGLRGAKGA